MRRNSLHIVTLNDNGRSSRGIFHIFKFQ